MTFPQPSSPATQFFSRKFYVSFHECLIHIHAHIHLHVYPFFFLTLLYITVLKFPFFSWCTLAHVNTKPYTLVFRLRDIPVIKIYHHLFLVPCWQFRLFPAFSYCKCMMLRRPCLHSVYLCTLVWFYLYGKFPAVWAMTDIVKLSSQETK